jgi:hypothetical protein
VPGSAEKIEGDAMRAGLLSALVLIMVLSGALKAAPQLTVQICPIIADSISSPFAGIDFVPIVDTVEIHCALPKAKYEREWHPQRSWYRGTPAIKPVKKGDPSPPDTLPITDAWGRWYFQPLPHARRTEPTRWQAQTPNGTPWELHLIRHDSTDTKSLRVAEFELLHHDSVLCHQITQHDPFHDFVVSAWIWQDTCILSIVTTTQSTVQNYRQSFTQRYRVLRNGIDLDSASCFGYTYFSGHPFYFFEQAGKWGWNYNGVESTERFERLFFDQCCEPGMWNEHWEPDGFRIFGERDGIWYRIVGQIAEK